VASRKPPSEVDRMPGDYNEPRRQQPAAPDDFGSALTLAPLSDADRALRTGRALAVLRSYNAEDLAPMLGLVDLPETGPHIAGPINVACPHCNAPAGTRCVSTASREPSDKPHTARRRRAAQAKERIEEETRRG
jgi:hypothetical protein